MFRATLKQNAHVALASQNAQVHWSHKIIRKPLATKFFAHPTYVMAREKLLSRMWREHVLFGATVWPMLAFFGVANFFKA
jgi:hypothetical protein